jgi:hypothetical protein
MTETDQQRAESQSLSLKKPLIWLAVPFVVCIPYFWLLLFYFPARGARPPHLTVEHLRVHWFFFWLFTYFPFSAICFISSVIMLARRARANSAARGVMVLAALFTVLVVGFLAMILIFG